MKPKPTGPTSVIQETLQMMDDAIKNFPGVGQGDNRKMLCELAEDAARSVEVTWCEETLYAPNDRQQLTTFVPDIPDEVVIDATDHILADIEDWGEGSFVHPNPHGGEDCKVALSQPEMYIVDQNGRLVPGGKVMVRYIDVTEET